MREIMSVLGGLKGEKLGICQCHEHLMLRKGEGYYINPDLCMDDVEKSAAEAESYRRAGGRTLIDAQPVGCCRMEKGLCEIAERSGVQILASTGFHKRVFYPRGHWLFRKTERELQSIFEAEIFQGMYIDCDRQFSGRQTKARAGIVKLALESTDSFRAEKALFTAAISAAVHGERSLLVHTEPESPVTEFLAFAEKLGMEPGRIALCHMDRTKAERAVHLEALAWGAYLEYDTIGRFKYHDNEREAEQIEEILDKGFGGRLLLSLDTTAARMKAYNKEAIGLDYILTEFIPFMEKRGMERSVILKMLTDNSRRYLEA